MPAGLASWNFEEEGEEEGVGRGEEEKGVGSRRRGKGGRKNNTGTFEKPHELIEIFLEFHGVSFQEKWKWYPAVVWASHRSSVLRKLEWG